MQPGEEQELVPRGLRARVEIDERVGRLPHVGDARRPGMELDRRVVREPDQRRGAVRDEVLLALARVRFGVLPPGHPVRRVRRRLLLPEALGADAVREAVQVERAALQVGEQRRGDRREVADEVALGDGRARRRGPGRAPCRGWSARARGPGRSTSALAGSPSSSASSSVGGRGELGPFGMRGLLTVARVQSRSGLALTSSFVRPLRTDRGWSSGSQPSTACSSRLCSTSQLSLPRSRSRLDAHEDDLAAQLLAVQIHVQLARVDRRARSSASWSSHVPRSQTITSPPPYSPAGITPSKLS